MMVKKLVFISGSQMTILVVLKYFLTILTHISYMLCLVIVNAMELFTADVLNNNLTEVVYDSLSLEIFTHL